MERMKEKLDKTLKSYTVPFDNTRNCQDKLLAAGFVVVDKNGILYENTAGYANFDASRAYKRDTVSSLSSMTELVTVICCLQLVERKILSLDTPIDGLQEMAYPPQQQSSQHPNTLRTLLSQRLYTTDGKFNPYKEVSSRSGPQSTAVDWAGFYLKKVRGVCLSEYMQDNIFEVLGMTSSGFHPRAHRTRLQTALRQTSGQLMPASQSTTYPARQGRDDKRDLERGGSGLFSTPHDFALLLHGILSNKLLRPDTLGEMFKPQLKGNDKVDLELFVKDPHNSWVAPEASPATTDIRLNYGLGGLLHLAGVPGKRGAGSLMWSGENNGRWWIDRTTGIAGAVLTHVEPRGDRVVIEMYDKLERQVYTSVTEFQNEKNLARLRKRKRGPEDEMPRRPTLTDFYHTLD
ncbi:beta-lactamase/transpeptidase-like protein [Astrocystis sublimbata]|nr:beta-lactamase/transpeptidase-like protein [Astrocystis sublimbata]